MRNFFLIAVLVLVSCNSNQQNTKQDEPENEKSKCFTYPSDIDSLQIQNLYDSARWYVYTWHCDESYKPKSDTSKSITFGELPLKFDNLTFKHDTVELNFNFMDKQQSILPSMTRDTKELSTGVGFDIKTGAKVYMLSPNGYSSTIKGGANRYENPLQPEVLAYIKNNWNKLDSCFKELVERKQIMK
jgi:hypothetical protein